LVEPCQGSEIAHFFFYPALSHGAIHNQPFKGWLIVVQVILFAFSNKN